MLPICIGCLFLGVSLGLFLFIIIGIAFFIRVISLYFDRKRGSKNYFLTDGGIRILEHIYGFKKYLLAVEDDKLKFLLRDDPSYFEKILPYAIAMGIGDGWLNKCFNHLQYDIFGGLVSDGKNNNYSLDSSDLVKLRDGIVDSISSISLIKNGYKKGYPYHDVMGKSSSFCGDDGLYDIFVDYMRKYSSKKYGNKR